MVDKDRIKYMSIREFRDVGFLQEINRRLLHPCGLAIAIHDSPGESTTMRIWDYRDDPEGMVFDTGEIQQYKIDAVNELFDAHVEGRLKYFGTVIQETNTTLPPLEGN